MELWVKVLFGRPGLWIRISWAQRPCRPQLMSKLALNQDPTPQREGVSRVRKPGLLFPVRLWHLPARGPRGAIEPGPGRCRISSHSSFSLGSVTDRWSKTGRLGSFVQVCSYLCGLRGLKAIKFLPEEVYVWTSPQGWFRGFSLVITELSNSWNVI